MSISTGQAKLTRAMKDLGALWGRTRPMWRDDVARHFESEHIQPLEHKVRGAVSAMSQMSEILQRVRRDCQ